VAATICRALEQGGTTMKHLNAVFASSLIALALATAAVAKPADLDTFDSSGSASTATVTFDAGGFSSTNESQTYDLETYVPQWSLGVIGVDIDGANLKVAQVEGSSLIHVELNDASSGASLDRLTFSVSADANTPKGSYPMQVTLENTKFGDTHTITIVAEVQ
jgi:hypothetical protein